MAIYPDDRVDPRTADCRPLAFCSGVGGMVGAQAIGNSAETKISGDIRPFPAANDTRGYCPERLRLCGGIRDLASYSYPGSTWPARLGGSSRPDAAFHQG